MTNKEEFIQIYNDNIKRKGSDALMEYLLSDKSDFFKAPCSTRYHSSYEGGLLDHTINVYKCLKEYIRRDRCKELYRMAEYSDESIAIAALLHDLCKINIYKPGTRNVKENGKWVQVPSYGFEDNLPYGHGEKSVYIISGFMRLQRDEAFAIRYHMGFSGIEDRNTIGSVFEKFPLAFALSVADMEATYFLEGKD